MTSFSQISSRKLFGLSVVVYMANIALLVFAFGLLTATTLKPLEYLFLIGIGGYMIALLEHYRVLKPLTLGTPLGGPAFVFTLLLIPLYPAFVILSWFYQTEYEVDHEDFKFMRG